MLFPNLSFHFQFIKKNENVEILEVMKKSFEEKTLK